MMSLRFPRVTACGATIRPPSGWEANAVMSCSMSLASRTARAHNFIPSDGAAASAAWKKPTLGAASGLKTNPTRSALGAISLNNSTHLPPIEFSKIGKAGDVLAGTCQTRRKGAANRVADECEYDRYGPRFLLKDPCHLIRTGHHDVGHHGDQLSCKGVSLLGIAASPTIVDLDIASFNPAQALEASQQRCDIRLSLRIPLGVPHEHADAPHPLGLMRPRRERPCRHRAAEQCDEVAPFHPSPRPHAAAAVRDGRGTWLASNKPDERLAAWLRFSWRFPGDSLQPPP